MKKITFFYSATQSLLVAAVFVIVEFTKGGIAPWLTATFPHLSLQIAVAVAGFLLVFHLCGLGITTAVENSTWLRKRIMGNRFIEGVWINAVQSVVTDEWTGGIVNIYYEKGAMVISGESFTSDGKSTGEFHSNHSFYSESELAFTYYKGDYTQLEAESEGFSVYHFQKGSQAPQAFRGYFSPNNKLLNFHLYGERLQEKLTGYSKQQKGERVGAFIEQVQREHAAKQE